MRSLDAPRGRRAALALLAAGLGLLARHLLGATRPTMPVVAGVALACLAVAVVALDRAAGPMPGPELATPRRRPGRGSLAAGLRAAPAHLGRGAADLAASVRDIVRCGVAAVPAAPIRAVSVALGLASTAALAVELAARADQPADNGSSLALWVVSMALYVLPFALGGAPGRGSRLFGPAGVGAAHERASVRAAATAAARRSWRSALDWMADHRQPLQDAGLILAASLVARIALLGRWPDVIDGDEGLVGVVARGFGANRGNVFSTTFAYGNLYHLLVAAVLKLLGPTAAAVRLVGAVGGALAAPATYVAGRWMFGRRVGLVAGWLVAASYLHIHLSRTSHAQGVDGFLAAWVLLALARGLATGHLGWMAVAGVGLGMAQHFYVGARAVDLAVVALVVGMALLDPEWLRRTAAGWAVALGGAIVAAGPMVVWAVRRPGDYLTRINQVGLFQTSVGSEALAAGTPAWRLVLDHAYRAVLVPIVTPVEGFVSARLPMMDFIWAALFMLGAGLAIRHLRDWRSVALLSQLASFGVALALGAQVEINSYRAAGLLPASALLAGLALVTVAGALLGSFPGNGATQGDGRRRAEADGAGRPAVGGAVRAGWSRIVPEPTGGLAIALVGTVAALVAGYNAGYYFLDHVPRCRYLGGDVGTQAASLGGTWIAEHAPDAYVVALTEPDYSLGAYPSVDFLTGRAAQDLSGDGSLEWSGPVAPGATSPASAVPPPLFNVKPGTSLETALSVAQRGPTVFWVATGAGHDGELEAIRQRMPGGREVALARCGKDLARLYAVGRP